MANGAGSAVNETEDFLINNEFHTKVLILEFTHMHQKGKTLRI